MVHGLSCSAACGTFLDQGSNPWSPALAGGFLTTAPPGKSPVLVFIHVYKPKVCRAVYPFRGTLWRCFSGMLSRLPAYALTPEELIQ